MANELIITVNDREKRATCREVVALCGEYDVEIGGDWPKTQGGTKRDGWIGLMRIRPPHGVVPRTYDGPGPIPFGPLHLGEAYLVASVEAGAASVSMKDSNLVRDLLAYYPVESVVPVRFVLWWTDGDVVDLAATGEFSVKVVEPFGELHDGASGFDIFRGPEGDKGDDGDDGKSAYELAVEGGFTGTQAEWLESLVGKATVGYVPEEGDLTKLHEISVRTSESESVIVVANTAVDADDEADDESDGDGGSVDGGKTVLASKGYVDAKDSAQTAALSSHAGNSTAHVTSGERAAWGAKYDRPSGGIPYSDMSPEVKAKLDEGATNAAAIGSEASSRVAADTALGARIGRLEGEDAANTKSVRAIAGEEVAKVVANADASFDTLKEIADWIQNDTTGAAKMAADIEELKTGKADDEDLAAVAKSGSYDDLTGKPTIPAAVTVDAALATQGAAADAKAVGDALRGGFTEWVFSDVPQGFSVKNVWYETQTPHGARWDVSYNESAGITMSDQTSRDATELTFEEYGVLDVGMTATRHLITPTKTSQLTNDGDGTNAFVKTNDTRLSNARTPTAHHATHAANGSDPIAPEDIGAAAASDLPYRLVEPGKWEFSSDGIVDSLNPRIAWVENKWVLTVDAGGFDVRTDGSGDESALSVDFYVEFLQETITATRASLPGHLLDRAGNRVVVSGDTTLTLPEANPGYLRDFLVRLEISGSTVPTITFAAPTGETLTYETDGDEFPVPDDAEGTWLYSFTETAAHKFAVSLKKVNEVAAPQAQGGS